MADTITDFVTKRIRPRGLTVLMWITFTMAWWIGLCVGTGRVILFW